MKLTGAKVEAFLRRPDPNCPAILVFGPDEGLVRERAVQLAKGVVDDLNDPFRVVEIFGSELKNDPTRLSDEALSLSFGGGRRVVRIRQASDACVAACDLLLNSDVSADALVVLDGGDLNPRSKLRKLFESSKKGICIPCYADNARNLPNVVRENLAKHGLKVEPDAMALLCQSLGSDRSVTRGELDKLALYMNDEPIVTAEHVRQVVGDSAANVIDDVVEAAAIGNTNQLESTLTRLLAGGTAPVQIVRACQRHFHRLHLARGQMATGLNIVEATKALRPPVMFMRENAFKRQLSLWTPNKLNRAFELLVQCENDCKTTGYPDTIILGHTLLTIAKAAPL